MGGQPMEMIMVSRRPKADGDDRYGNGDVMANGKVPPLERWR